MKKLNKEQIRFIKIYIVRKQDFPECMDRDTFISQLSGISKFDKKLFIKELNNAVNLSERNKIKLQRHLDYVHYLTYFTKNTEYYELMYNLNLLNKCIDNFIENYNNNKIDNLFDDLFKELAIKKATY